MSKVLQSTASFIRFLASTSDRLFWASISLSVLVTLTEGIGVLLLLPMLEVAGIETHNAGVGRVSETVAGLIEALGIDPGIVPILILFLATMVTHEGINRARTVVHARLHAETAAGLRALTFDAVAHTQWRYFCRQPIAALSKRLTLSVGRTLTALIALETATISFSVALLYLAFAALVSPVITLLVAAVGSLLYLSIVRQLATSREIGERADHRCQQLYGLTTEYLSAMKTVKSYGQVEDCVERFENAARQVGQSHLEDRKHQARVEQRFKIGAALALAAIIYVAVGVLRIHTADLLFLLLLFSRVMPKLTIVTRYSFEFASHVPSFEDVELLVEECAAQAERSTSLPDDSTELPRSWDIEVRDVNFGYHADRPVLKGVTFDIPDRSAVAIVGASGAGKSTLLDLVMGLLRAETGEIRIGGIKLTHQLAESLRPQIGYVGQETFLFNASIRENLEWGCDGATDTGIAEVLTLARSEFVHDLDGGLDAAVGDRGVLLSGGQRQRLSLARALLRRPRLLILDEATSALDMENEAQIMKAVLKLKASMSILIVSHRPSAVRDADLIHVVDGGRIVASGNWSEVRHEARMRATG